MSSLISAVVIILSLGFPQHSMGYKWITLKFNDTIPKDAIKLSERTYVGRAIYYNLVLPAEVYNTTLAIILHNDQHIIKSDFEVLTATELYKWEQISSAGEVSPNVVLAGNAWNNEPIYIGKTTYRDDCSQTHIASILIGSHTIIPWDTWTNRMKSYALICDFNTNWIETSSINLPKNAVSGGIGNDNLEYFIGRLLGPSFWELGMIIPQKNITIAEYENIHMESFYAKVLVGDTNQYKWQPSKFGKIPDYAVSCRQRNSGEIRYIVKLDRASIQRLPSELRLYPYYEVLVRNV